MGEAVAYEPDSILKVVYGFIWAMEDALPVIGIALQVLIVLFGAAVVLAGLIIGIKLIVDGWRQI